MMSQNYAAEWLTYREAQELTGLGRTTLWRTVSAGLIPVSVHGRSKRLHRRSLEEFMWSKVSGAGDESTGDDR